MNEALLGDPFNWRYNILRLTSDIVGIEITNKLLDTFIQIEKGNLSNKDRDIICDLIINLVPDHDKQMKIVSLFASVETKSKNIKNINANSDWHKCEKSS